MFNFKSKKVTEENNKVKSTETYMEPYNGVPQLTQSAKMNSVWVHLLCSLSGAIALFFLSLRLRYILVLNTLPSDYLGFSELVLFLIGLLGLSGLLPMTLWFFARSGDMLASLIKK